MIPCAVASTTGNLFASASPVLVHACALRALRGLCCGNECCEIQMSICYKDNNSNGWLIFLCVLSRIFGGSRSAAPLCFDHQEGRQHILPLRCRHVEHTRIWAGSRVSGKVGGAVAPPPGMKGGAVAVEKGYGGGGDGSSCNPIPVYRGVGAAVGSVKGGGVGSSCGGGCGTGLGVGAACTAGCTTTGGGGDGSSCGPIPVYKGVGAAVGAWVGGGAMAAAPGSRLVGCDGAGVVACATV